jgi:hypothetical protein
VLLTNRARKIFSAPSQKHLDVRRIDYVNMHVRRVEKRTQRHIQIQRRKPIPTFKKKKWRSSHFVCVARRGIITAGSRNDSWGDYTGGVGGLIGGATREIIIKWWLSRECEIGWMIWMRMLCKSGRPRATPLARQHFYFAREGKPLKEVAMLGERMCNLHSIRLGALVHCDILDICFCLCQNFYSSLFN